MSLAFDLHRAEQAIARLYMAEHPPLTVRQFQVVTEIVAKPLIQCAIAARTGVDFRTLSVLLAGLEERGAVGQIEGKDRRSTLACIRPKGLKWWKISRACMERVERRLWNSIILAGGKDDLIRNLCFLGGNNVRFTDSYERHVRHANGAVSRPTGRRAQHVEQ